MRNFGVHQEPRSPIQPLNFFGSYSLVGIGKFNLLFLWFMGGGKGKVSWRNLSATVVFQGFKFQGLAG